MFVTVLLFILGLGLLIKGGDWFVDGASGLAKRFKISEMLIGATVVSIGTTLPEIMVSATSAIGGHGEIAYGNALGSIICNTALVAAITMAFRPSKVDKKSFSTATVFFFVAAVFYAIVAVFFRIFSRITGVILLVIFAAYMATLIVEMKKSPSITSLSEQNDQNTEPPAEKKGKLALEILFIVSGAALIAVGAKLLVDNGTKIAEAMGVSEAVIALTFVALGTSLPELATAVTALIKGHSSLSIGNVIGANLFNIVLVSGISASLSPFSIPADRTLFGINSSLLVDVPLMLAVMLVMTVPPLVSGKLRRWQGILLLAVYAAFVAFQFVY